MTFIHYYPVGL